MGAGSWPKKGEGAKGQRVLRIWSGVRCLVGGRDVYPSPPPAWAQDYQRMLDLMRDIILATDLAHHLRIFKDLQKMAEGVCL